MQVSCQCGGIEFSAPASGPQALWICHCTECQKQSSSAFGVSVTFERFDPPSSDQSTIEVWTRSTDSGNQLKCYFCTTCGSRLFHQTVDKDGVEGDTTTIKGGALVNRTDLPWTKACHIWTKSALVPIPKGVMSYPGEPAEGDFMEISRNQGFVKHSVKAERSHQNAV